MNVLDNPAWPSLTGVHRHLGNVRDRAARYHADISPFAALAIPTPEAQADLAALLAPGEIVAIAGDHGASERNGFRILQGLSIRQMVLDTPIDGPRVAPARLGVADSTEMLALAELTRPGPFAVRTIAMGDYVGFRENGRLVAMGGERLRPPGFTEVSGICTHPDFRGRRYAEAIVRELSRSIQARGERPFLHVAIGSPSEAVATALYASLGYEERCSMAFTILERLP